ncbi:MAG TPA: TIGR02594 family protein [Xanthobacteraceae bacterium]|nr:TIGR02594 family protein [Xanthobacteraceae bacterium]
MNAPTAVERPIEPAAAVIAPTPSPGKAERVEASLGGGISAAAPAALPIARDEMSRPEPAFSRSEGAKEFPAPKEFPAALERHASLGPSSSDAKFDAAYVPPEKMRVAYDAPPPMERPKSIGKRQYVDESNYSGRGSPDALLEALRHMGAHAKALGLPPSLWCADFMNYVLKHVGLNATGSRAARSFLKYGQKIDEPRVGAIAIFSRGRDGGHVGIVRGTDGNGNPIVISGNYADRVAEAVYPKSRVLAYVVPRELPAATAKSEPDAKP